MANFTPLQISALGRLIQSHFSQATLGQAVLEGLDTNIETYSTARSLVLVILDLCKAVNGEDRVPSLVNGLKTANPDPTLHTALDAFLEGPRSESGMFDVLLVTEIPVIPMINRRSLRVHLGDLLPPDSGYRAFSVSGPMASGKTHSAELIRFIAKRVGATAVTIVLVDQARTLSLREALNKIALSVRRKVSDVSELLPDSPSEAQATERFVDWLGGISQDFQQTGERYWLIFDGLDRPTAAVFRDLLVPQLLTAAVDGNLHGIQLFLLGDNAKRVHKASRMVLHEDAVPVKETDIKQFLETYVASKGWLLTAQDLVDLMDYVISGAEWPYDHKVMNEIVSRLVDVVSMLGKPDSPGEKHVKVVQ
jgi:hypothetical protein